MKKLSLDPLSLDKETIAMLDAQQLLEVTGGAYLAASGSTGCGSGGSTCSAENSTGCGGGASTCSKGTSTGCGSGGSTCFA